MSVSHVTAWWGGYPYLAFLNDTTDELVYASYVGSGGNCGQDTTTGNWEYQCDVIHQEVPVGRYLRTAAMAADPAGRPIIAFQDRGVEDGTADLAVAQPLDAAPPGSGGNCGPGWTWVCTTPDQGDPYLVEAISVSIASNYAGTAIAYNEWDQALGHGHLKVMWRFVPQFGDGFESGDTTSWDVTVP
jgi:hypothetical protein